MPYKLLLADDSVTIQRVIELTFADEDVQVIAVGDGKQAIHRAQQDPPDIILADVGMPERDGYEVATFIKQTPELKHIPVLLLTGAFEPIDEGRARAAGCDGVLVKPFEPQLVINRVKDLISGRKQPAEPAQPEPVAAPAVAAPPPTAATADVPHTPSVPAASTAPAGSIEDYFDRLDAAFSSLDTGAMLNAASAAGDQAAPAPAAAPPSSSGDFANLGDALAGWDPDITGDPSRSAITLTPPPAIDLGWGTSPSASESQGELAPSAAPMPPAPEPVHQFVAPPAPQPPPVATPAPPSASFQAPSTPPPAPPSLAEAFAALLAAEQGRPFSPAASHGQGGSVDESVIEEVTRRVLDRMSDRVVKDTVVDTAERLVREEIDRIKSNARYTPNFELRTPNSKRRPSNSDSKLLGR